MATNTEGSFPKTEIGGWDLYASELRQICPVGVIVAWAKTLTNTPSLPNGWAECDGSVISDADSPMNGETLPNLNGTADSDRLFLRGNSTSSGTGGSDSQSAGHSHGRSTGTTTAGLGGIGQTYYESFPSVSSTSVTINVIPPCYNVVYIMRIK